MLRFISDVVARRAALAVATFAIAAISGCDLGTVEVPVTEPTLVVHAVLNPSASSQVVLLERTLTGNVEIPDAIYDPADPIVTAGGDPVSNAVVEIIDSAGIVVRGTEDRLAGIDSGRGTGVYHVPLPGSLLVPGGTYRLHVRTPDGEELTGSTRIPRPASRTTGGLTKTINRDHDIVATQWNRVDGARSYAIRIESPFGPFLLFTDSTAIKITGDLRNLFANNLERVFIPGFRQDIVITAVDSNFYDYYRTNNDPFTGAGIISRVKGGLGLFGSVVPLNTGTLTIIADQTEPVEGQYRLLASSSDQDLAAQISLYIESPAARADLPSALSGHYAFGNTPTRGDGLIGRLQGKAISFAFLLNQLAGDTLEVFDGEVVGDSLKGNFVRQPRENTVVFLRQP